MIYNEYPLFRPLKKEDRPLFEEAFGKNPPEISEFTFTNLYAWREIYKIEVSILENMVILRCGVEGKPGFFPPIGEGAGVKEVIEKILRDSGGVFIRIPEAVKSLFDADARFNLEFDADNSDYLFRAKDLILLEGRNYDGKRNIIRKFKSSCEYAYVKLSESNISECLEFQDKWCSVKGCDSIKGLNEERRAVAEILESFSSFALLGGAIRIENVICAVAIAERLNPDTLVMHVLKAEPSIAGLYQAITNEFLATEARDFKYVNLEQDLGQEGLRKAKLSYHPVRMVKKYNLRLR